MNPWERGAARVARGLAVSGLYAVLATPQARGWLEASMPGHMLVQIPLLFLLGVAAGSLLSPGRTEALVAGSGGPVAWLLLALFGLGYWMLPRSLDGSLTNPRMETFKFLGLPFLVGLPLALSWRGLPFLGRSFVWINMASMVAVVGWLYAAAPARLCTSYVTGEQDLTGRLLMGLGGGLLVLWVVRFFFGGVAATGTGLKRGEDPECTA